MQDRTSSVSNLEYSTAGSSDDSSGDETVNEFGFVVQRKPPTKPSLRQTLKDGHRRKKWAKILSNYTRYRQDHPTRFQRQVRKGVPVQLRGMVWALLLDLEGLIRRHPGRYAALLQIPLPHAETGDQIVRDLHRTFPTHSLFRDIRSGGQSKLRNVLHAYAVYNPLAGYVQGMAFLVGTFLMYFTEEQAFWAFYSLMEKHGMETLFFEGLPGLHEKIYQFTGLLKQHLPNLHQHLAKEHMEAALFAPQWFFTLFIYTLPPPFVLRIWDVFFSEGWKIIFRVPLALFKLKEHELLKLDMQELMTAIKALADDIPDYKLMKRVFRFRFATSEMEALSAEYWAANSQVRAAIDRDRQARDAARQNVS